MKRKEYVEVVSNSTLQVVGRGTLIEYTPNTIIIETVDPLIQRVTLKRYDARVHHFKGLRPKRLLVWRDEVIVPTR